MDLKEGPLRSGTVYLLRRLAFLRGIAKRACRGWVIRQSFYGGTICLDAIEHSWLWTDQSNCEKCDRPLQDALLEFSQARPRLVDIGSNLGIMSLGVLLRNPRARLVAVDPNPRVHRLLQKSLRYNGLSDRARLVTAAVAPANTSVRFDFAGSVLGHVTTTGTDVPAVTVAQLLREIPAGESLLIKVDVEGFELSLLPDLVEAARARQAMIVVELHPLGLNGMGDPVRGLELLRSGGASLADLDGRPVTSVDPGAFTQVVATWS
jgi:FkbM family methyltransferase